MCGIRDSPNQTTLAQKSTLSNPTQSTSLTDGCAASGVAAAAVRTASPALQRQHPIGRHTPGIDAQRGVLSPNNCLTSGQSPLFVLFLLGALLAESKAMFCGMLMFGSQRCCLLASSMCACVRACDRERECMCVCCLLYTSDAADES